MKIFIRLRVVAMLVILVAAGIAAPALHAHADKADLLPVGSKLARASRLVNLTMGKGELVEVKGDIADVLVADPSIADVVAIQSNKLYIVGSKLGDTNLVVLDAGGNELERYDIHVKIDSTALQAYLDTTFPGEHVRVQALNGRVMLNGEVSTPDVASRITSVVAAYISQVMQKEGPTDKLIVNLLKVRGQQQVMLKVRILEADKSLLKELGLETSLTGTGSTFGNVSSTISETTRTGLTQDPFGIGTLVFNNGNFGPAKLLLNALEKDNLVRTLAEPNLTAISGQEAGFLAGGEFPVPTGRDQNGNIVVQYKNFGVSLDFKPVVLSSDRISLQLKTEVSSLSQENAVTLAQLSVPGLNIRRASTTVEVPSGGGLMIAGLLQSQTVKAMAGLPGIANVPVIGDLIKSRSFNHQESELVVLVTAYLVKPYGDPVAAAPTPAVPLPHGAVAPQSPIKTGRNVPPAQDNPTALRQTESQAESTDASTDDQNTPLRTTFAKNIRHIYGRKAPAMLNEPGRYGYIMD